MSVSKVSQGYHEEIVQLFIKFPADWVDFN